MTPVLLVPIEPVDYAALDALVKPLELALGSPVHLHRTNEINPNSAFDPSRKQYNSTIILSLLLQRFPNSTNKILGITALDLFVPVLTYVFGEAQLGGSTCLVSTHRLDDVMYGLPPNRSLLRERLLKEAIHELGHNFGLIHCRSYECAMHSSTSVEEIDLKHATFCSDCRRQI